MSCAAAARSRTPAPEHAVCLRRAFAAAPLKCGARHPHRLALHDVPLEAGPTEVARGSHRLTNHLNGPPGALSRDDLLYQSAREATPLGWNQRPPVCRTGLPERAA